MCALYALDSHSIHPYVGAGERLEVCAVRSRGLQLSRHSVQAAVEGQLQAQLVTTLRVRVRQMQLLAKISVTLWKA